MRFSPAMKTFATACMSLAGIEITGCFDLAIQQTNSEHSSELRMKTLLTEICNCQHLFFLIVFPQIGSMCDRWHQECLHFAWRISQWFKLILWYELSGEFSSTSTDLDLVQAMVVSILNTAKNYGLHLKSLDSRTLSFDESTDRYSRVLTLRIN